MGTIPYTKLYVSGLSKTEKILLRKVLALAYEAARREGRPMCVLADIAPMAIALDFKLWPRAKDTVRCDRAMKICNIISNALEAANSSPAGEC